MAETMAPPVPTQVSDGLTPTLLSHGHELVFEDLGINDMAVRCKCGDVWVHMPEDGQTFAEVIELAGVHAGKLSG